MSLIQAGGHGEAGLQFVEELGGWLATLAALERGLVAESSSGGGSSATAAAAGARRARVANVLYFYNTQVSQPVFSG